MFQPARRVLGATAAVAAFALGGAAIADANSSSTGTTGPTGPGSSGAPFSGPAHGTAAHEDAEKTVTGAAATKAKAAALKAVGGGIATAVSTDCTQHGYEVEVTKSDGSKVEIHLDSSFQVLQGRRGAGHGGPGNASGAGPGGPPPAA